MEKKQLYSSKSVGSYGAFEIEISVGATNLPDLSSRDITWAADRAANSIMAAIMEAVIQKDEKAMLQKATGRLELVGLFPEPIFVEEIPNGYCSDWCCKHLPWFVVTTRLGRFKIGWRKRVIEIDWTDTVGTQTAEVLFAKEDVTKEKRLIHAWSIEDAKRYVDAIFAQPSVEALEVV